MKPLATRVKRKICDVCNGAGGTCSACSGRGGTLVHWPGEGTMEEEDLPGRIHRLKAKFEETVSLVETYRKDAEKRAAILTELTREVEQLRRENASLRESAREDFDAANNWRRYVAIVGEKRASLYVVPPEKENEH